MTDAKRVVTVKEVRFVGEVESTLSSDTGFLQLQMNEDLSADYMQSEPETNR